MPLPASSEAERKCEDFGAVCHAGGGGDGGGGGGGKRLRAPAAVIVCGSGSTWTFKHVQACR